MASCSTALFSSLPMKIVPYDPEARKPKPKPKSKSKAKSMATTKTAEHSRSEVGPPKEGGGEWLRIDDDFLMLDSNASVQVAKASHPIDHGDTFTGFRDASELKNPEHNQFGGEPLDEGEPNHPTRVVEGDLVIVGLLGGISREFPFVVESDAAEEYHSATRVEPSNGAFDCQEDDYRALAGNDGPHAGQHGDLDAAGACALSGDDAESIHHDRSLAEDESLFDGVGVTDGSPATRKRTRPPSVDTIVIAPAAVPDALPELELEHPQMAKRRRMAERREESPILDPVSTFRSTPLPTSRGGVSNSRASIEPSLGPLDRDSKRDGVGTQRPSPSDFYTEDDSGDSAYSCRTGQELLHSPREFISPSKGIEGEQDFNLDSERRAENREGSSREFEEGHKGGLGQDVELFSRTLAKTSHQRKRSDCPLQEEKHNLSRPTLRLQDSSTMSMRASRQVTSHQPTQLYRPKMQNRPRTCSSRTSSPGTKAGGEINSTHGPSLNMSYQITDHTVWAVPTGSSVVTAIVRCNDLKWPLNSAALGHKFLGGESKVIRMTQLLPDSWMLVGYQYEGGASGPYRRRSLKADWISSSRSDAANHATDHSNDDWYEEDEKGEEGTEEYSQRTHKPWLESDEERLLSFKDKQGMEWKDICTRFPDRTPGAVKLRYYTLRKKVSKGY